MDRETVLRVQQAAAKLRYQSLDLALAAGVEGAHLGPAYSMAELMACLYHGVMNHRPTEREYDRDRFILSKGHGVLGYYTMLQQTGYYEEALFASFEKKDTLLAGHPVKNEQVGIEFSTGSLGHGLPLGVGLAAGLRQRGGAGSVYVMMGDGECNEGSVWEAAMMAAHLGLGNLVLIIDRNRLQSDGLSRDIIDLGDLAQKWRDFGWETREVNGHDVPAILDVLQTRNRPLSKPFALVAHTVKGKGVSFFENNNDWHHNTLSPQQYEAAKQELDKTQEVTW